MVQTTPRTLITSYSVEGIFLGMNCVLYAFCVYTLWGQKFLSCRLLLFINTVQFLLCAAQIFLHAIFLFIVFTVLTGDVPAYLHHVNVYILGASIIYNINFITGGCLSIWRLYVLYDNNLRVCIPALLVWLAQICMSGITIYGCATTPIITTRFSAINMALWALITTLNLCVAIPICLRLCMAQKKTHTILSRSPYKSIAIIMVECGALITLCSVGMMILYAHNYAYALVSLGISTELAVASQLLITARHGMLSQGHNTFSPTLTTLEIDTMRTQSSHADAPMVPAKAKTHRSLAPAPSLRDDKDWKSLDDI